MPPTPTLTRPTLALAVLGLLTALLLAVPAPSYAAARFSLADAPIPASCQHPATRLDGYTKDFGVNGDGASLGSAALDHAHARYGRLRGHRGRVAVATLSCNAGGVGWPQLLLVYAPGPRLLGTIDLARLRTAQEHADVTSVRFRRGHVAVRFRGYEGAGFVVSTYRGTIGWRHGGVRFAHTPPLTIDYRAGYDPDTSSEDWWFWGKVQDEGDAAIWLRPAPKDFQRFVQRRWTRLAASTDSCDGGDPTVYVDRFGGRRFAFGGETYCGGAAYLYGRTKGRWRVLWGGQDLSACSALTTIQRRGFAAVGGSCYTATGTVRTLGHWPTS